MIPDFQSLMRPTLELLNDGQTRRAMVIREYLSDRFNLTHEERAQILPSGRSKLMANRVGWTLTHLSQAGLVERPSRAHYRITSDGLEALRRYPDRIDMRVLENYPSYVDFRNRTHDNESSPEMDLKPDSTAVEQNVPEGVTPDELVEQAVRTNRAAVEGEVLAAALALEPTGFEDLVIRLLGAMGYGRSGSLERTSVSGDAGIDGIISQDPLGLDRIYVQAKRYAIDHPIDRPRIHEFAGALLGKQGDRGVYITTSRFTEGARREAERINARIELIDGRRLAGLLVAHGVGVQAERIETLYRLDEDFFESL